jgi:predicted nucleotidyltransferase
MRNLERLYLPIEKYAVFAAEYARLAKENEIQTIQSMLLHHQILLAFRRIKKQIKQWIKPLNILHL